MDEAGNMLKSESECKQPECTITLSGKQFKSDEKIMEFSVMWIIKRILCRLGFHNWSANRGGVRICLWCPVVDRYYGISGYLRRQFDITTYQRESDAELREDFKKRLK